ncbi:hypothetical protein BJI49_11660 [Acetobacter pasteurianus]|nr:hypothetical protein BJI49_11660 [Acetobacter pasteurianus]
MKGQGNSIHAVAQAGGRGPVIEDMTQMAATGRATDRRPLHAERRIQPLFDRARQSTIEARPTRTALEFRARIERGRIASRAGKTPRLVFGQERAGPGCFGSGIAQDTILRRSQPFVPFGDRMRHGIAWRRICDTSTQANAVEAKQNCRRDVMKPLLMRTCHPVLRSDADGGYRLRRNLFRTRL